MGILRNREVQNGPIRIEDFADDGDGDGFINDYANYLFDSDSELAKSEDDLRENEEVQQAICLSRRKKPKRFRRREAVEYVDGFPVKRNMGAQKWRRVENAKAVATFADEHDICFDGTDLLPETITAFTRLLRDEVTMKIWNEFIEKDEMEQSKLLLQLEREINEEVSKAKPEDPTKSLKKDDDVLRKHHPAFSALSCFQRLDKKFRDCLLNHRNIQYDYMREVESSIRTFFDDSPTGVYLESIASRVKRFYVHAVSQFLQLKSKTHATEEDARKMVEVNNEAPTFLPPKIYLVALVKKKRRQKYSKGRSDDWDWEEVELNEGICC